MCPVRIGLLLALAVVGCSRKDEPKARPAETSAPAVSVNAVAAEKQGRCPRFAPARSVGRVESKSVLEASGLAASRSMSNVLWLHNDSGNAERLYAMQQGGALRGAFDLTGAACVDWEDLTIGQEKPGGPWYLYVADTGTNNDPRERTTIYRVQEPSLPEAPSETNLTDVRSFQLSYPDRRIYDSETLMFDPDDRDLYIVTKTTTGHSQVFRAPLPLPEAVQVVEVTEIQTPHTGKRGSERVTGGDISPDGRMILLKTYTRAFLWPRPKGMTLQQALREPPCDVPLADEPQGEAVAFAADGSGYFTVSEGAYQPVYFFKLLDDE